MNVVFGFSGSGRLNDREPPKPSTTTANAGGPLNDRKQKSTSSVAGLLGSAAIFASAFCFYLSTAVIRWSREAVSIDPAYFVFVRFLLGFGIVCLGLLIRRRPMNPVNHHLLLGRMLFNCVAVYCFYRAVTLTSVAEANILNMTYPLFIAVISWILLKAQRDAVAVGIVCVAFAGVWLVLSPGRIVFSTDNLWGLASGVSAAAAIVYLNVSRQVHDTQTILFYMFGPGTVLMFLLGYDRIFIPDALSARYLLWCGALGIGGQYLLTLGFRYVTAVEGAVISSTRILLAALLGPLLVQDPPLGLTGWIGALLIFGANVYLALRKITTH